MHSRKARGKCVQTTPAERPFNPNTKKLQTKADIEQELKEQYRAIENDNLVFQVQNLFPSEKEEINSERSLKCILDGMSDKGNEKKALHNIRRAAKKGNPCHRHLSHTWRARTVSQQPFGYVKFIR